MRRRSQGSRLQSTPTVAYSRCPSPARIVPGERLMTDYPRDMVGYGAAPPQAQWPGGARIALQIVLNYEEGAENNILHGDAASEAFLRDHRRGPPTGAAPHEYRV